MRNLVIGLAMASTALASPALARDGQWYVELGGGPMIVEDSDIAIDAGGGVDTDDSSTFATIDNDYGYDFGGIVGYDFGGIRLEAEASWREADVDELAVGPVGLAGDNSSGLGPSNAGLYDAAGDVNSLSFMVNGLLDFGDDDGIQGFVGGGAGVARTEYQFTIDQSAGSAFDDSDTGFAWQLLAGVRAPLSDSVDVGLRYRFFNHQNVDLVDALGRDAEADFRSHSLLGTLTFNFGGTPEPEYKTCPNGTEVLVTETCPVVAPPPPPQTKTCPNGSVIPVNQACPVPPPPPPACARGPYLVFFDWDQSNLNATAIETLNNAVSSYANCGTASVMLAGHTDTSGSARYNEGLAERRNASVRAYLNQRGIPDARISSEGFGETRPRIATGDGVRELGNRRVEITYGPNAGM
ncbi:OmpA family protein [Qipengyuania sp. JC766]|uniref:OmpA family protein n=1 Tax=Qipengyuania sp. JC766 TaxID=3232139 RepID=UPI003459C2E3